MPAVGANEGFEGDAADEVPEDEPEFGDEVGSQFEDLTDKKFQKRSLDRILPVRCVLKGRNGQNQSEKTRFTGLRAYPMPHVCQKKSFWCLVSGV